VLAPALSSFIIRIMSTSSGLSAEDPQPRSAGEWAAWLSQQEATWRTVYQANPNLLIADCNREHESSQDYEGREVLELLQNASDAAAEAGEPSQVEIHLMPEGLVVANTGPAFQKRWSILPANKQSKPKAQKKARDNRQQGARLPRNSELVTLANHRQRRASNRLQLGLCEGIGFKANG